ncbi:glycosyltransferase [Thermodesulfobacteriota bacterium]
MKSKEQKKQFADFLAPDRDTWRARNRYYYDQLEDLLSFHISPSQSVVEIGCGTGDLLASLKPTKGLGLDFSSEMIKKAKQKFPAQDFPNLNFVVDDAEDLHVREAFDYVILSDCIGEFTDTWKSFRNLQQVVSPQSRVIITYFNALWEPILWIGERLGMKMPQDYQNWMSLADIENMLLLNGLEVVNQGYHLLFPKKILFLSKFMNKYLARLPLIRKLCLGVYLVARPRQDMHNFSREYSVSVVIPCRNEKGNIRSAVERLPAMGSHTEIIFVDGNSNDGTVEEIEKVIAEFEGSRDIKLIHQIPPGSGDGSDHGRMLKLGKGDAVRKGFAAAGGDILMILDADLTVPPEDLPKFYLALSEGHGEFINGSRLIYPMEKDAMRFLNKLANKFFSMLFTWILDQRIGDTLCGTKVLFRKDYEKIARNRHFFGDFDPFGDFDLLFGAVKQNFKIIDVPIRYRERTYGEIKIERFKHGLLLLKMSALGFMKFKFRHR